MRSHRHPMMRRRPRLGPLGLFVRARLRRRIFVWFAGSILVTAVVVSGVVSTVSRVGEPSWRQDFERMRTFVGRQLGAVWEDPARRDALARATATDLDVKVELLSPDGVTVLRLGDFGRCRGASVDVPALRDGRVVGLMRACAERHYGPGWALPLALLCAVGVMWAASGKVARRLARPLDELVGVVKRIGAGDLGARTQLHCGQPDEIGVVAEAVNDMAARIEKQLADQRELLAAVSHELRTPLSRMRILTELARDGAEPRTYDDLDREVVEMDGLVGQLLASSRVDFGSLSVRPMPAGDLALRALERVGVEPTRLSVEPSSLTVDADPTLVQRALVNLLDNAVKHAGGVDAFEVREGEGTVRFEVLDRGPGITREEAVAIFRPFKRGADGKSEGLGLGLSLVERIASAHKGKAWAEPREGGGARLVLELPRATRPVSPVAAPVSA